jgi:excisionase family DNA binding protein
MAHTADVMLSSMTDSNLLTVAALARRLGLSATWLKNEAEAGRVPSLRMGRSLRFNAMAVERALLSRASGDEAGKAVADVR